MAYIETLNGFNIAPKDAVRAFATVADMQAATDLAAGMTCHTNGFHEEGDGGAAYYAISTEGDANGMDVLALQNSLYAALVVTEPYVTPEQFGAYGDGEKDDTDALKRMLAASSWCLMDGSYLTSEMLELNGTHILSKTGTIGFYDKSTYGIAGLFSLAGEAAIEGLTFDCEHDSAYADSTQQPLGVAIYANGYSTYLSVKNCTFKNVETCAMYLYQNGASMDIQGCQFLPDKANAYLCDYIRLMSAGGVAVVTIADCYFKGIGLTASDNTKNYSGIYAANFNPKSLTISTCTFDSIGRQGNHRLGAIDFYVDVSNATIMGNRFVNGAWQQVRFNRCRNIIFSGNDIEINASAYRMSEAFIIVSKTDDVFDVRNISITNNRLRSNTDGAGSTSTSGVTYGIQLSVSGVATRVMNSINIDRNEIVGYVINPIYFDAFAGELAVCENVIRCSGAPYAIVFAGTTGYDSLLIDILGNTIDGNGSGGITISFSSVGRCLIARNTFACNNWAIKLSNGAAIDILNNYIVRSSVNNGIDGSGARVGFNNFMGFTATNLLLYNVTMKFQNYSDGTLLS